MGYPEAQYVIDELKNDIGDVYNAVGAKIVCRGTIGTKFTLTRTDGYYPEMKTEITENSKKISDELYAEIITVPCGNYSVEIDFDGMIMNETVNAAEIGVHYTFSYSSYQILASFTSSGNFTVPDGVNKIFVDAAGGGGGGGGGYGGSSSSAGGGGGGGSSEVIKRAVPVTEGQEISITIGTGGAGGLSRGYRESGKPTNGGNGGSTLLGSLLTVPGGSGGRAASESSGGSGGTSGGGRGGSAGSNGRNGSNNGGLGGAGASAKGNFSSHGGGGGGAGTAKGKGGAGGDAYNSTSEIGSGMEDGASGVGAGSGGGGGAGDSNDNRGGGGGAGKSGYLDIYKGVQVN